MLELTLRGAAAGILLLLACKLARRQPLAGRNNIGALFTVGTAAYAIVSSAMIAPLSGPLPQLLVVLATLNSVFFWWFATALFDDGFRWHYWRLLPALFMAGLFALRRIGSGWVAGDADERLQQWLIIAMMLHALWLALSHYRDDLVEQRRRFRVVFAGLIGTTGLTIAVVELVLLGATPPRWLNLFQAGVVLLLSGAFALWVVDPVEALADERPAAPPGPLADPQDELARRRLETSMRDGLYREESLSIAALAAHIDYPEYRLRRVINRSLGYRNFNAFLNHYRIAEARRVLADPGCSQRQITQIALGLGYASIAPFNRAFKAATGTTPSAYRRQALADATRR